MSLPASSWRGWASVDALGSPALLEGGKAVAVPPPARFGAEAAYRAGCRLEHPQPAIAGRQWLAGLEQGSCCALPGRAAMPHAVGHIRQSRGYGCTQEVATALPLRTIVDLEQSDPNAVPSCCDESCRPK
jgi:hypothetical protein